MDRRQRVLNFVVPHGRTGVELGPLSRPIVLKSDGNVLYADHLSTEGLRHQYRDHPTLGPDGIEGIVPVDVVLGEGGLPRALGSRGPVDYIVASHVVEHVPDAIGWLRECGEALNEGGVFCLMVPDKRFTFDHFRTPTSVGALVAAHLLRLRTPPPEAVYEHFARACEVDVPATWRGQPVPDRLIVGGPPAALDATATAVASGRHIDVHCTVFTPYSFGRVLTELLALGLLPFECAALEPTRPCESEFFVLLRKRSDLGAAARAATVPRLDPARHDALPPAAGWPKRTRAAARRWVRSLRGRRS
ncbi:methyltransferase domain-containing protein [Methylorubrum thiocyanatum]|uniref:methyltransferase domain-containing protein n=1 Tax=Methylorubrum thiocyanatum TaxID=47958 RepID=UPI0035C84C65